MGTVLEMKFKKCDGCYQREYTRIDYKTYKCNFCGSEYIDSSLTKIACETEIETVRFADGTSLNLKGRTKITETRYK